ncbi:GNAT family N-acetyltransferase [Desulfobacula sp.]|uniref:GNAT family N-acetyltransferase n=1 Tax=Desulfobacula sp. TaxID=2593537 RepID=UPI0025C4A402|nr:GNAT family N-acetyltransferase [Desulfobacula sp.]MBC2704684.1 EVE domain-containing protein [Desulfobacula sp.]
MNILIDTNIIIPLEPGSLTDFEINTELALQFHKLVQKSGNIIYIHPAVEYDLNRDKNADRMTLRKTLVKRYNVIDSPPPITILDAVHIGTPELGSNDYVDNCFLASVKGDAVDYLVTEDNGIHKKAKRADLQSRVLYLRDAISLLQDFFDETPPPPPSVETKKVYALDEQDPIFCSLRKDYSPGFDPWLQKCRRKHRDAYVIFNKGDTSLAGICIHKKEDCLPVGESGKTLKLCTFKVSETHHGNRYGELLLKTVFDYADKNNYQHLYFTTFPKHDDLIEFAKSFGFDSVEKQDEDEIFMQKSLVFSEEDTLKYSPLDFHIKFGPRVTLFGSNSTFIVPIKPEFHDVLFPEMREELSLFPDQKPCGNSIKKAYLSNSATKLLRPGDNVLFYRSKVKPSITAIGIVESFIRSTDANQIARFVGSRTVYRYVDIADMCMKSKKDTLAIKFRYVKNLESSIGIKELKKNSVLNGAPQSITKIKPERVEWIKQKLQM